MTVELLQDDADNWTILVRRTSGIVEGPILLGQLTKEQAQRETLLRYPFTDIACYDKHTIKAIREGRVKGVMPKL